MDLEIYHLLGILQLTSDLSDSNKIDHYMSPQEIEQIEEEHNRNMWFSQPILTYFMWHQYEKSTIRRRIGYKRNLCLISRPFFTQKNLVPSPSQ